MKGLRKFLAIPVLLCMGTVCGLAQTNGAKDSKVRERIDAIIRETLKRGEFTTPQGIKAIIRSHPSAEDVAEVKSYGDRALGPLEKHFSSTNPREYQLAMRLMGEIGGDGIIEPLKKVIFFDSSARKREYALRSITQGPWDEASKVISAAAANDADPRVRKVANELLNDHSP